ncbi:CBS domain-containing protein [Raphanus sativus]|uniref:CBS domain-containing protein CBSX5 n=1 Tax=Raphanus sativus TaxID=3726 RepID=A0A6J0MM27_RAPSA|nr:CBS domain-containing protein CBSX5 [Raphanus sativus]KAJ4907581.1 CBS domain-containing protein [Raphanus sativus]
MALALLSHEVSDLCIGKPPLRCLSAVTATVADVISALKSSDEPFLSVWSCDHDETNDDINKCECECVGKICMADVICYLTESDNKALSLSSVSVSVLLPKSRSIVVHVQSSCKLIEAINLITGGAQNLIVPIQTKPITKRRQQTRNAVVSLTTTIATTTHKNSRQFCWITQEDIIRFLLDSISVFSPLPSLSISDLGVINSTHAILSVDYHSSSAASTVTAVSRAIADNISVAVVDDGECDGEDTRAILIGEISPMTLACCDESAAAAVATLSAGDLMTYIDGGGPPESLVRVVRNRLEEKGLVGLISLVDSLSGSSSSSDEEAPVGRRTKSSYGRSVSSAARMARKSVAIVCNRRSSLMAVMIQAIARRVSYVWVVDEDGCLVGMVTFVDILKLFRGFLDDQH